MMSGVRRPDQEDSEEMHLARDTLNSGHHQGAFVEYILLAFINADRENFEMLRPVVSQLVRKYGLKCTCEEVRRQLGGFGA